MIKVKTPQTAFAVIFLLVCIGFFTTCSNEVTEPIRTGTLMNQRSVRTHTLSEMTEQECLVLKYFSFALERFVYL